MEKILTEELKKLQANDRGLNVSKTNFVIFHSQKNLTINIPQKDPIKYLGIIMTLIGINTLQLFVIKSVVI